jgi:hypothetical protein
MSFAGKWMELEIIMLSEINEAQKVKYCISCLFVESRSNMMLTKMAESHIHIHVIYIQLYHSVGGSVRGGGGEEGH